MINMKKLGKDEADCIVEYGGQSAKLSYRPSLYTQERIDNLGVKEMPDGSKYSILDFLEEILISWDVADGGTAAKPKMVPTTAKAMKSLPAPFLRLCLNAILDDGGDVGEAEGTSNAG